MSMQTLVQQFWIESERGWGMRPDGYTLHLNEMGRAKFVGEFMQMQDMRAGGRVPDEYNFTGDAKSVAVSGDLYERVRSEIEDLGVTYWRTRSLDVLESELRREILEATQ